MATKVSIPALIQALGGKENLAQATHCATRLRVTTRDKSKIDEAALKAIPGCAGRCEQRHTDPDHHRC